MDVCGFFTGLFLICYSVQAALAESPICGVYEEGTQGALTCSTNATSFVSLQPRIEIDGEYMQFGSCDSQRRECSAQPGYLTSLTLNQTTSTKSVTLYIDRMSRQMTRSRCYMDYKALPSYACVIQVYVKPSKPTCQPPVFVDEGSAALITCTSAQVYPKGKCEFMMEDGNTTTTTPRSLTYTTENKNATTYPGDQEVICRLRVPVTGSEKSSYRFTVGIIPEVDGVDGILESVKVFSEPIPPLQLKATALYAPDENDHVFRYPQSEELRVDVPVTGNPPPNRISLMVKHDPTQSPVPVSSLDYFTLYNSTAGSDGGVFVVVLSKNLKKIGDSFYTLTLSNGVIGSALSEYKFSVTGSQALPEESEDDKPLLFFVGIGVGAFGAVLVLLVVSIFAARKCRQPKNTKETQSRSLPPIPQESPATSDSSWTQDHEGDISTRSSREKNDGEPYASISLHEVDVRPTITAKGLNLAGPIPNFNMQNDDRNNTSPMTSAESFTLNPDRLNGTKFTEDIVVVEGAPEIYPRRSSACALRFCSIPTSDLLTNLADSSDMSV